MGNHLSLEPERQNRGHLSLDPQLNGRGFVSKQWNYTKSDPAQGRREQLYRVQLRHNQLTGTRYLVLNGQVVPGSRGVTSASAEEVLVYDSIDGHRMQCQISYNLRWRYRCTVATNGIVEELPEAMTVSGDPVRNLIAALDLPVDARVETSRSIGVGKSAVIEYQVLTTTTYKRVIETWHRFSGFQKLHQRVRSAYTGSHLVSSFPDMPSGLVSPLTDQKDVKFIEARQRALNTYLDRLLHMAKAPSNPDLMLFLGMDPVSGAERPQETHTREEDGGRSTLAFEDSTSASWGSRSESHLGAQSSEGAGDVGGGVATGTGVSPPLQRSGVGGDAPQTDRVAL